MAARAALRSPLPALRRLPPSSRPHLLPTITLPAKASIPVSTNPPRRGFITLPSPPPQHLTATRTLPYPLPPLYDLIADVDSYSRFVPYCSTSRVTSWSAPDPATGRRYPTVADLHVGWGGLNEVFTSRLDCVPGKSVEAVSGCDAEKGSGSVFKSLVTVWSVRAVEGAKEEEPSTQVHLDIRFQFANPVYAAVSSAVSDKVAGVMIEAFERRAREQLGASAGR